MLSEGTENSQGSAGIDVDALLSSIETNTSHEIPMSAQQEAPAPQAKEWELEWNGQKIKADEDKFRKWAQQGYDYNQKISAFKSEKDTWSKDFQQKQQEWEKQYAPYKEIDSFIKQNPEWWQHVEQSYQQRLQPQAQIPDEVKSYLDPIVKDYSQVKSFIQDYQRQQIEKESKEQDTRLDSEIKSISSKYNLDFSQKDETGLSLEQRVLDHALQNGIPTFKAAFADYYQDHLEKLAEARGKEAVMQEMKKRKQLGLLSESSTPTRSVSEPASVKGQSYNDIHRDILKELGL